MLVWHLESMRQTSARMWFMFCPFLLTTLKRGRKAPLNEPSLQQFCQWSYVLRYSSPFWTFLLRALIFVCLFACLPACLCLYVCLRVFVVCSLRGFSYQQPNAQPVTNSASMSRVCVGHNAHLTKMQASGCASGSGINETAHLHQVRGRRHAQVLSGEQVHVRHRVGVLDTLLQQAVDPTDEQWRRLTPWPTGIIARA